MHSRNSTASNQAIAQDTARPTDAQVAGFRTGEFQRDSYVPVEFDSAAEQTAYKSGFADGFRAAEAGITGDRASVAPAAPASRVVYRNTGRSSARASTARASRQVYYDYQQPRKRSFWQKHRDKLTVAMGAGGGAVVGGLIGGKKGAAIGALAGGGGSALYTYKIRKRDNRY
jgi:hypothetical protein